MRAINGGYLPRTCSNPNESEPTAVSSAQAHHESFRSVYPTPESNAARRLRFPRSRDPGVFSAPGVRAPRHRFSDDQRFCVAAWSERGDDGERGCDTVGTRAGRNYECDVDDVDQSARTKPDCD